MGSLIQAEPVAAAPPSSSAYRIVYRTRALGGGSTLASALVAVPFGAPPAQPRSIVAWAHPTSGVARRCAPSLSSKKFLTIPGADDFLRRGFIVVAPDYPGLGSPGVHPYLVGNSEGWSVLDAVRAARQIPGAMADNRFAIWGHSQGGQAALFAGSLDTSYAPDLNLVGVAAAAPATNLDALLRRDAGSIGGKTIMALALWSWQRVFGTRTAELLSPEAIRAVETTANICLESLVDLIELSVASKPLIHALPSAETFLSSEPWKRLVSQNSAPVKRFGAPLFIAQGDADSLVEPAVTRQYVKRLCKSGNRVLLISLPGVGHDLAAWAVEKEAVHWVADRFRREQAPTSCAASRD